MANTEFFLIRPDDEKAPSQISFSRGGVPIVLKFKDGKATAPEKIKIPTATGEDGGDDASTIDVKLAVLSRFGHIVSDKPPKARGTAVTGEKRETEESK